MNRRRTCIFILLAVLLGSCGTIRKAMHPGRYCVEKNCHSERVEESVYCKFHYTTKMYDIVGKAGRLKKESEGLEE